MALELRKYQREAIDGLYSYWSDGRGDNPLIVAPTGAGKSLIIAKIIEDALEFPETKILMLTHVAELIKQNAEELIGILPHVDLGFYSASLGQKRLDRQVTFAGIQSIWQRAFDMIPAPDLVVIDEAHLVPKNSETRYGKFLADLKVCNPNVKIVGLTATPYRLDSGYLHKGDGALFDGIAYDIPVGMLMDEGYLSPVVSKGSAKNKIDLTNVHLRGGEFIESELAIAASDPALVRATVAEICERGADRKSWLVFSSGVEHAKMIAAEMLVNGIVAEVITGADNKTDRAQKIADFKASRLRCLININVLTAGFNHPGTDLVALVRATNSPGLYIQMVGRGTRLAPGKKDCLVLDYGGNVERHGFIDAVRIKDKSAGTGGGDAPAKECPECETMVPAGLRVCPCGHEFPAPELNHGARGYDGAILTSQLVAEWVDVDSVTYQRHMKAGKPDSVRVSYDCGLKTISEWLCPDHGGYAASRYVARKPALGATAMTTDDALKEAHENWKWPGRVKIRPRADDPRYDEIVQLDYQSGRMPPRRGDEVDWTKGYSAAGGNDFDDEIPF